MRYVLKLYRIFNYQVMINYAVFRCIYSLMNAALLFFMIGLTMHDSLNDFYILLNAKSYFLYLVSFPGISVSPSIDDALRRIGTYNYLSRNIKNALIESLFFIYRYTYRFSC